MSRRSVTLVLLVLVMVIAMAAPGLATKKAPNPNPMALLHANEHSRVQQTADESSAVETDPAPMAITEIDLIGVDVLPDGRSYRGTVIGGLSGMTYDPIRDVYYVISDDKSEFAPARYYTVRVHVNPKAASPVHVQFNDVTYIKNNGSFYPLDGIDLEGIEWFSKDEIFVSNERDVSGDPSVLLLDPPDAVAESLAVPCYYLPNDCGQLGINENLAFESLTLTPNHETLVTATESARQQDGEPSTHTTGSNARVLEFATSDFDPVSEYVYPVEPIPKGVEANGGDNGLSEMVAIDNAGTFLAMERSYVGGFGNTIRLYETSTVGATDVSGDAVLPGGFVPMSKELKVDLETDLGLVPGVTIDNMEGMAFGPTLPDGRRLLVLVSDNNFNPTYQNTIFIVLAVSLAAAS